MSLTGTAPLKVLHVTTRMILGGADENTLFTVNLLDPARFKVALAVGGGSEPAMLAQIASHVEVIEIPELVREIALRDDLIAYVDFLRSSPSPGGAPIGGTGPVAEGFIAVVVGLTGLVLIARFAGSRRDHDDPPADEPAEPSPE